MQSEVVIPDLCTSSNQAECQGTCDGQNGPEAGQTLTLVLTRSRSGIKNPTEAEELQSRLRLRSCR